MKYFVIRATDLIELQREVNRFLGLGWNLAGGLAAYFRPDGGPVYLQAMTIKDYGR